MATIKWGDPRLPQRFWGKTKINDKTGCWEWTAFIGANGYGGWFHVSGSGPARIRELPHRHAYSVLVGPITEETLNHDCAVRHCVNPNAGHAATPMSAADNVRDGKRRTTRCPQGHAYTAANTLMVGPQKNRRACRTCDNARSREYWRSTRKEQEKAARRAAGYRGGFAETATCPSGHERTEENTYVTPSGYRTCRVCRKERSAAYNRRTKGA